MRLVSVYIAFSKPHISTEKISAKNNLSESCFFLKIHFSPPQAPLDAIFRHSMQFPNVFECFSDDTTTFPVWTAYKQPDFLSKPHISKTAYKHKILLKPHISNPCLYAYMHISIYTGGESDLSLEITKISMKLKILPELGEIAKPFFATFFCCHRTDAMKTFT